LPRRYGSPTTCWRRLREWEESGVLLEPWRAFLADLNERGKIRWDECFVDGSFAPAKKGGRAWARPSAARARSGWFWQMARVLSWEHTWTRHCRRGSSSWAKRSIRSRSAGPGRPGTRPERLIADRGYDSDPLREGPLDRGIRPVIPHPSSLEPQEALSPGRTGTPALPQAMDHRADDCLVWQLPQADRAMGP
ncbi:MAG: hypothetical protein QF787_17730, partial [Nitrospinota bacterium]|nr:hypothetical protein [Nitrospinota bacterium]